MKWIEFVYVVKECLADDEMRRVYMSRRQKSWNGRVNDFLKYEMALS